MSKPQMSCWF